MEAPRWKHDCLGCEFLGRYESHRFLISEFAEEWDLYVHWKRDGTVDTVVARYGDVGHEYCSGLYAAPYLPLVEAMRRVIAKHVKRVL